MASLLISGEEKYYIVTGVEDDFRNDGRSCEDYRKVSVKTRVLSSANGSSEITLVSFILCIVGCVYHLIVDDCLKF